MQNFKQWNRCYVGKRGPAIASPAFGQEGKRRRIYGKVTIRLDFVSRTRQEGKKKEKGTMQRRSILSIISSTDVDGVLLRRSLRYSGFRSSPLREEKERKKRLR